MTTAPFVSKDTYDRAALEAELQRDEGVVYTMYKDTRGFWTIGVGHNLSITQSQFTVDALFTDDCNGAEASLDAHWPWWRNLDQIRQRVMLNMMFNLGSSGLSEFPKFLAAMQSGDWATAAAEMQDSLWWSQVGQRAVRLQYMVLNGALMPDTI
jgi:lysozyme